MNPTNPSSLIPILKKEWDTLQPLKVEDDKRLLKKFRLEWNYNSNHIEGNTLTYGETELLLIFGETKGNHNIREYDEMQAHDVAIKHVYDLAREKSELREADVRNLNKIILKEPFWKETITPDGSPSRRQIFPGEYKQFPNSVRTATGEIFEYASPIDVPPKMQKLVEFIRMISTNRQDLPGDLAKMHHDFSLIHPFDDGNGRVARLLVNYVLLRHGFPPVIIKSKDKKNYLSVLHNADVGNLEPFREYMAREMIWSLETAIKAAKGESIDEPGDLEKEIDVFV
ncbi:MAG: Fic family protein, partial [Verrucomicrobiae bacterium]|nr:Fic family protein [Verrucomicrobiae bacterium]